MDNYKIDSHKLHYHVPRVHHWLEGKVVYPLYMEISPAGMCNHRCTFCGLDFMEYQKKHLDPIILKERISEMAKLGLKSIMFAGEGEPFLHKNISEIVLHTKQAGIDAAFTTNGVLFKKPLAEKILGDTEWLKVSINAGTSGTYEKIHRTKPSDFDTVIANMSDAARIRRDNSYRCTLGMQLVLLPENITEVVTLAYLARDIGMDYLVIKPYSQHLFSKTHIYENIKYNDCLSLSDELEKVNTAEFNVIFRIRAMAKWDEGTRNYNRCFALPFWSYLDAGGNVWGCSVYLGDDRFLYGNIYENTFQEIWEGEKRQKSLQWVETKLNTDQCRINCRMDEINRYLWDLKNPPAHVNFI